MLPVDELRLNFNPASLVLLNAVLGFLMFGIALDTKLEDFRRVARMPWAMAVGIAAQFVVLPAVTYTLTLLLGVAPSIALGMILVACCPPGNISNLLTHRAKGNVALSVSMTAISNALSVVLMPLNFAFWGGMHPTASACSRRLRWTRWKWWATSSSSSACRLCWASGAPVSAYHPALQAGWH
jgi:BASS family bile acid:Na+ symporter